MRTTLGQTFGTKKAKKAITSKTENAITAEGTVRPLAGTPRAKFDSVTAATLATMAEATSRMATRDELQSVANDAKPRPKANLDAVNPEGVYTIEELIGTDTFSSIAIKDWQDAVKAGRPIETISRFVSNRLQSMGVRTDSVQKLRLLRYLLYLIEFKNMLVTKGMKGKMLPKFEAGKPPAHEIPPAVFGQMKRKFAQNGTVTKFDLDLLLTTACVLSLMIDSYEVDTFDLRDDLRLEAKEMTTYFREVGAKDVAMGKEAIQKAGLTKAEAAQRKIAKLRLPLVFPQAGVGRNKKK